MVGIIKSSKYKVMPWKNGRGSTAQIAIDPPEAEFPGEGFFWRLSAASVGTSSPFSQFLGCDRWLVVWRGEGLRLNGVELEPLKPVNFSGDDLIQCDLIAGGVEDLGLIYRRDRIQADMQVREGGDEKGILRLSPGIHFLFCVRGEFSVNQREIQVGECVRIENENTVMIGAQPETKFVHVTLCPL